MATAPPPTPTPPPISTTPGFVAVETYPNGLAQGYMVVNGLPVFGGTRTPGGPFLPANNALSPQQRAQISSQLNAMSLFNSSAGGGGGGGGGLGGSKPQPDFSVIGQFLPGLNQMVQGILGANVPPDEQALRNTVLASLMRYLKGGPGEPGQLFGLPGRYTGQINEFVGSQVNTQNQALAVQYKQAQQDILANAAVQGFNPAGALGALAQTYQQQLSGIQSNASSLRFQAAEGARNRIAQAFLPQAVSTSQFGLNIPNQRIAALSGAFGNISGGASSLQNAAFTPAQIQAQLQAAQLGADTQKSIAAAQMQNQIFLQGLQNQGNLATANANQLNPWQTLLGLGAGQFSISAANNAANWLLPAAGKTATNWGGTLLSNLPWST